MRQRQRLLTFRQKEQVRSWYEKGLPVRVMAERLNVPRTDRQKRDIIYAELHRCGLRIVGSQNQVPSGPQVRLDHRKIIRLYRSGLGAPAIAKQIGCGTTIVQKVAAKAGILRKQKGWTSQHGYVKVRVGGKYVPQHRHLMEQHLGRKLEPLETVHHINGNGLDNRLENLQLRKGKHGKGVVLRCRQCGSHDIETLPIEEHKA